MPGCSVCVADYVVELTFCSGDIEAYWVLFLSVLRGLEHV
ncbi:hypothetical protein HMPREF0577_0170 [Mobiluncus mulieris ATCC 35243]|nr:hypothetical protein HMPREF0577_0170 [Mobiluncus mulieris ATCC 35243]